MNYRKTDAGLRFEVFEDNIVKVASCEKVLSRYSKAYKSGEKKYITRQLGYSFCYDATKEDNWMLSADDSFSASVISSQNAIVFPRKTEKLNIEEKANSTLIKTGKNYFLFDLGREEVGYLTLKVTSPKPQKLTICYGEHIADGKVRQIIEERDFSVEVIVNAGTTDYTNYFRRLGLRYLEIHSEAELEVEYASVLPCVYPLNVIERNFENPLHQRIYNTSVRTLQLCMHDHYEDCPWREQAMYTMDSRNQMLCGYYAFKEYTFPRENLYFINKDDRPDGFLSICYPSTARLFIPSFSLHYFTQVLEYTTYSKDLTLAKSVLSRLESILDTFLMSLENGLASSIDGTWNFYEWSDGLHGYDEVIKEHIKSGKKEAALNCMLSIALQNMQKICDILGVDTNYNSLAEEINTNIKSVFFDKSGGIFKNIEGMEGTSELVNSLAVLCGAVSGVEAERICDILTSTNSLTDISLSMLCFKFDALIKVDKEKYTPYIIKTIEEKYKNMLDNGATSFWETEDGESAFDNAGSLCHGWSAMPVYYLSILKND